MVPKHNLQPRILIVEENEYHGLIMGRQISRRVEGSQVVVASGADDSLRYAHLQHFDIAVVDFVLSDCDGLSLVNSLHQINPRLAIIVVAEEISERVTKEVFRCGCDELLIKDSSYYAVIPRMVAGLWSRMRMQVRSTHREADARQHNRLEELTESQSELLKEIDNHVNLIIRASGQVLGYINLEDNDLAQSMRLIQASAQSIRESLKSTAQQVETTEESDYRERLDHNEMVLEPVNSGS